MWWGRRWGGGSVDFSKISPTKNETSETTLGIRLVFFLTFLAPYGCKNVSFFSSNQVYQQNKIFKTIFNSR